MALLQGEAEALEEMEMEGEEVGVDPPAPAPAEGLPLGEGVEETEGGSVALGHGEGDTLAEEDEQCVEDGEALVLEH